MQRAFSIVIACLVLTAQALAVDVDKLPAPTGYVNDFADVVDGGSKAQLESFCRRVEDQLGVQMALVTIPSLDGRDVRDVALRMSRKWGVGAKASNQGVLLLLAIQDHKSDVETGRGIEPYITDGFAGSTLRAMRLDLRAGNYGAALRQAARSMATQIAQGKNVSFDASGELSLPPVPQGDRSSRRGRGGDGFPFGLIVFGIFALIFFFGRRRRRGGPYGGGYYRGGRGSNFTTGVIAGSVLNDLLRGGGRGGSSWGGGGGFGGDGGGGGGFGGFGGGDFGGGGASSDW